MLLYIVFSLTLPKSNTSSHTLMYTKCLCCCSVTKCWPRQRCDCCFASLMLPCQHSGKHKHTKSTKKQNKTVLLLLGQCVPRAEQYYQKIIKCKLEVPWTKVFLTELYRQAKAICYVCLWCIHNRTTRSSCPTHQRITESINYQLLNDLLTMHSSTDKNCFL